MKISFFLAVASILLVSCTKEEPIDIKNASRGTLKVSCTVYDSLTSDLISNANGWIKFGSYSPRTIDYQKNGHFRSDDQGKFDFEVEYNNGRPIFPTQYVHIYNGLKYGEKIINQAFGEVDLKIKCLDIGYVNLILQDDTTINNKRSSFYGFLENQSTMNHTLPSYQDTSYILKIFPNFNFKYKLESSHLINILVPSGDTVDIIIPY